MKVKNGPYVLKQKFMGQVTADMFIDYAKIRIKAETGDGIVVSDGKICSRGDLMAAMRKGRNFCYWRLI